MTDTAVQALLAGDLKVLDDALASTLANCAAAIRPAAAACFEPRMRGPQGHFPLLAEAYGALCRNAGSPMNVFHHRDWAPPPHERWHGAYPIGDHLVGADRPVDRGLLGAVGKVMSAVLEAASARSGARVAIVPTARFLTLPGHASAIAASDDLRAAVIGVMETSPVPDCDDDTLVADAFRTAADTLANSGKEILVVAESPAIAQWLLAHGFDAEQLLVAPYPAASRFGTPHERRQERIRFGALGASRPVHQPERLAEYLLSREFADLDWIIRLDTRHAAGPLGQTPDALDRALGERGVQRLPAHLDQATYDATLTSLDVMLLPYGERYRSIGSGIFLECLCAGVVPLVPAGTTMRTLYEELGGDAPAMEDTSSAAIGRAVDQARQSLPALRQNAARVRAAWLDHPRGPRAWARRVSELLTRAMP